jgi:hypothetical protein
MLALVIGNAKRTHLLSVAFPALPNFSTLSHKRNDFILGNNVTCTVYCNHRIVAKFYNLEA